MEVQVGVGVGDSLMSICGFSGEVVSKVCDNNGGVSEDICE